MRGPGGRGSRSTKHLMSALITIQFSLRYLDSGIQESCRWRRGVSEQGVISLESQCQRKATGGNNFCIYPFHWQSTATTALLLIPCIKSGLQLAFPSRSSWWGFCHDRRYLTPTLPSHRIDLCLVLISVEWEQQLPSVERGAWLECLRVVNEVCLKKKPWGASIPRMSLVHHKTKSGHIIIITHLLFLTTLQLDVRHEGLHSSSPETTLNNEKRNKKKKNKNDMFEQFGDSVLEIII